MAEMGKRNDGGERERYLTDEDLLTEVLCRLPVKYILRCKAVSKTWYSLIKSPGFVKFHYQQAVTSDNAGDDKGATLIVQLFENEDVDDPEEDGSYSLFQLGGGSDDFIAHLKFPFSKGDYPGNPFSRLIGCDCGTVCVCVCVCVSKSSDIYIWNPATKQSKLIPPHTQYANPRLTRYGFAGAGEIKEALGFGFDPIDFDFKVVRVVSDKVCSSIFSEVYSAKRDAWRDIETELTDVPKNNKFVICLHGFLFATGGNGMMAFNLNKEVFVCDIKLPVSSNEARIADFKDSICVIVSEGDELGQKINLWTLDDEACLHGGGAKASWTFKLSIDVGVRFDSVHGFFNSVEFLLVADDRWFSYNSDNKAGRYIYPYPFCFFDEVFEYRESLLSVAGSKLVQWYDDDEDVGVAGSKLVQWYDDDEDVGNNFDSEDENEDYTEESGVDSEDDNEETLSDSGDDDG